MAGVRWRLCPGLVPLALLLGLLAAPLQAETTAAVPVVALIIDDLGQHPRHGQRIAGLPGPVACAFLPGLPHTRRGARQCHEQGKEVMLHQPLQAAAANDLGPGGVTIDMDRDEVIATVTDNLASIPHVSGMNSHMGSLLTRHPGHMLWVTQALHQFDPNAFFIDSFTTAQSVAHQIAAETGLAHGRRNVFLDPEPDPEIIEAEFRRWLALAHRDGVAIAIAHPYPETLEFLETELPRLKDAHGVMLVPVRKAITKQTEVSWPVYSSPSPPAAKSSKP